MHLISLGYTLLAFTMTFFFQISDFAFAQQAGPGAGPGQGAGMVATTLTTFETDDFSGSGNCALCHSRLTDEAGNDVSNDAQWRSTMMANAAKDPLWQAKISSEVDRNPHVQDVIEEKCSRCHMGMARYQAMTDGTDVGALSPGFLRPHSLPSRGRHGQCLLHPLPPDSTGQVGHIEQFYRKVCYRHRHRSAESIDIRTLRSTSSKPDEK